MQVCPCYWCNFIWYLLLHMLICSCNRYDYDHALKLKRMGMCSWFLWHRQGKTSVKTPLHMQVQLIHTYYLPISIDLSEKTIGRLTVSFCFRFGELAASDNGRSGEETSMSTLIHMFHHMHQKILLQQGRYFFLTQASLYLFHPRRKRVRRTRAAPTSLV